MSKTRRHKKKKNEHSNSSSLTSLVCGLLLGVFAAYIVMHFSSKTPTPSHNLTIEELTTPAPKFIALNRPEHNEQNTKQPQKEEKKEASQEKESLEKFSFYTTLANLEIQDTTPRKQKISTKKRHYLLQVASLQNQAKAKKLSQRISNVYLPSYIEKSTVKKDGENTIWFRVMVGPYTEKKIAEQHKIKLGSLGISPLLIRRN
jgi:cell division protein FtsN